jgi:hypothetical protein
MSDAVRSSAVVFALLVPSLATAQSTPPPATTAPSQTQQATEPDPDLQLNPAQPDFTLSALPTTLRMPAGKFSFRLTHRFARPIGLGSAGDFAADLFGLDSSARVGLELRYGVRPGTQVSVHRTNNRAIQLMGQHELLRQPSRPVGVQIVAGVEGANNFSEWFSGSIGVVLSREFADKGAIYVQPFFVSNVRPLTDLTSDEHTAMLGFGARVRLGQSRVYLVAEAAPRLAGYDAGVDHISFGIEKRAPDCSRRLDQ